VEASTEGSVLLAGLLLKLGGYGLIRILIPIFPIACFYFNSLIFILGFISIFYGSFSLFNQIDLKKMIAYLSIVHMNIFLLGLFSFNNVSLTGSIFLLLSHGLLSSVFFMIVGFFYEKFHSRNIYYFIGLNNKPRFVFIFFFIFLANISFPGTSSFVCELLIFIGLINKNMFLTFITIFATILSALFMALIYVKIAFGINNYFFFSFNIKYFQVY
jgi:NADH-quinone oxidoreductase subunit M